MSPSPWIRSSRTPVTLAVAAVISLCGLAAACGGSDDPSAGSTIEVSMKDFELTVSPDAVAPGDVTMEATNDGPTTHEFEIFSGADDVDLDALPIESDVADTSGLILVDEVEDVTAGTTAELAVTLEPGTYAIVCNLPGHFAQGMHTTLSVA